MEGLKEHRGRLRTYSRLVRGRASRDTDSTTDFEFLHPNQLRHETATLLWSVKQLPVLLSIHPRPYRAGTTYGSLRVNHDVLVQSLLRLLNTLHFVDLCLGPGRGSTVSVEDHYEYRNWLKNELGIEDSPLCCSSHWLAMRILAHNLDGAFSEDQCIADIEEDVLNRLHSSLHGKH